VWVTRQAPGASGVVHFSMKALMQNRGGIADALHDGPYRKPALVPAATWLDDKAPPVPANVKAERVTDLPVAATTQPSTGPTTSPGGVYTRLQKPSGVRITWNAGKGERAWLWAVYTKHGKQWKLHVVPGDQNELVVRDDPSFGDVTAVAIAAVDRTGNESKRVMPKLGK
jgi:hypothetical protein